VIPCGPPAGYVKKYVVQRGDTLSSIARLYGITYTTLQRANCMGSSTTIYAGQVLWVPNIPPRYPTVAPLPTFTKTSIPVPPTEPTTYP
jgi:LysM repeat protein